MAMLTRDQIYTAQQKPKFTCLIMEWCKIEDEPIFTIREEKEGYVSLKKLFVQHTVDDPSEATFAEKVFGDVGYWLDVRESNKLASHISQWREEAEVKRKAKAFKAITTEVKTGGRSAFTAAKFLIEEPWKDKKNPKVAKEAKETTRTASSVISSDVKRMREEGLLQ